MAATINPRDIQILGTTPRMVGVGLPPNIIVNPDNVDGLGLILNGIKRIWISATSQIFQIAKNDTVSPASITLTANVRNLTATPTLTIVPGSGTMSVVPALTAGVFSFTEAQLTSNTVTLRLSLTEDSVTYTDDFTFVKVREGDDSLNGYLTNESHTVPADYLGNVTSYAGASGTFNLLLGTLDVRTVSTFAVASGGNPDGLSVAITASGSNAGNYVVTGGFPTNKDTVTVTFNATFGTTVFPKVLTLTKSKAGQAGANGTDGTNGTNGVRGSRQFYVGLSGGANTWSDVLATSTASVDGGPVLNDQVTQYNNSAGYSQTKFWNGSVWVNVDAVIDGNLLVTGTVGASKVVVNAGAGANVWFDPNYADNSAWQVANWGGTPDRVTLTDGISSGTAMRSQAGLQASARGAFRTPVVVGKKYRISVKARKSSTANGLLYVRLDVGDTRSGAYSDTSAGLEAISTLNTSWQEFSSVWTATSPWASIMVLLNHTGTSGYMEAQDIRIEEMNAAGLIVQGGIIADQIDSRGLSIKDASGNIILAAGNSLPIGYAAPGTVNADLVPSINAAQTAANNAALSAANAQASANAANAAIANIGSDSILSKGEKPQVVQDWLTVDSERLGIVAQANVYGIVTERDNYNVAWGNLSSYLSGLSPAYNDTSQDTPINGASFRLYWVQLYDARQILLNKIADEAGKRAVWANVGGAGRPEDGATVGATIGVNLSGQITSGNASTYIANAAIGSAQIADASITNAKITNLEVSKVTAGQLSSSVYIRSQNYVGGVSGWNINADGTAEFSGVVVRGTVHATSGTLGQLTITSGGNIRLGQTGFNSGTGFWMGDVGGIPMLSIGNPSGSRMLWDGTDLSINSPTFDTFSANIPGGDLSATAPSPNSFTVYGSRAVSVSGGRPPYSYSWVAQTIGTSANNGVQITSGQDANSVSVGGVGDGIVNTAEVMCIVRDANGRTTVAAFNVSGTHPSSGGGE